MRRTAAIAVMLLALAVVVGANYILLGYGASRNEQFGKLSPRGVSPAPVVTKPAPALPRGGGEGENADD